LDDFIQRKNVDRILNGNDANETVNIFEDSINWGVSEPIVA
jgi:hypothetical protein